MFSLGSTAELYTAESVFNEAGLALAIERVLIMARLESIQIQKLQ